MTDGGDFVAVAADTSLKRQRRGRNKDLRWRFRLVSSVLGPRSSVLGPRSSVLGPRSSVLGPRSSVPGPPSSVLGPRSSVLGPRSSVIRCQTSIQRKNPEVPATLGDSPAVACRGNAGVRSARRESWAEPLFFSSSEAIHEAVPRSVGGGDGRGG